MTAPLFTDPAAILESAEGWEALPETAGRLATLVSANTHSIAEIVEVVSLDAALTANLLRRVNSAASGLGTPARTVRQATMLLGTHGLLVLALSASLSGPMKQAMPAYGLPEGALWRQSVAASLTCDVIRWHARSEVAAEAGTAGLLHDLGKVVLCRRFGAPVLDMLARAADSDSLDLLRAEATVLGVDHAQIGALVAREWGLADTIVDAIAQHHETGPGLTPTNAAVSLAHAMTPWVLAPSPEEEAGETVPEPDPASTYVHLLDVLDLDPGTFPALLAEAREKYAYLAVRYGID